MYYLYKENNWETSPTLRCHTFRAWKDLKTLRLESDIFCKDEKCPTFSWPSKKWNILWPSKKMSDTLRPSKNESHIVLLLKKSPTFPVCALSIGHLPTLNVGHWPTQCVGQSTAPLFLHKIIVFLHIWSVEVYWIYLSSGMKHVDRI